MSNSPTAETDTPCNCPKPDSLPFAATEENVLKMKEWLLNRYASTFNKCTHQRLPMMSGPPIKLNMDPDAPPTAVHTPTHFQSLNKYCIRDTHHTLSPFQQARSIPPNRYQTLTNAWNEYHSVPVKEENKHLLTFTTEFNR